ncbi:hypothetical protein ABKV19_021797 [Rosa sericea]
MASTSSARNIKGFSRNIKATIQVNSPHVTNVVFFDKPIPPVCKPGEETIIGAGPGDPEDLPEVFNKVMNTGQGLIKSFIKMVDNLFTDGYNDLATEIVNKVTEENDMPKVVIATGIIEEYTDAGKTKEALHVFRIFSDLEHCNPYTYSVIIKALVADSDPSFLEIAKECLMEMMGKGLQPSPSSYTAVYEAFSRQEKMEEAKQFLGEMKAKGFVADNKAMRAMRLVLKGKGAVIKSITDILFSDELEDYSDDSDDDDEIQNYSTEMESRFPPDSCLSFSKKHVIEDDPENPKDLQQVFDMMRKGRPVINTFTKMIIMLKKDGFFCQVQEVLSELESTNKIPDVVTHTGVMGIYSKADEVKEVLKVFMRMLSLGVAPNAYTYSVLIKALAKDPNFLGDVKMYTLEMMDKGMRPNARTYTAVFKAFARLKDFKVEKGKEFLKEMKARGFVPNKKAVMEVLKGRKGPVVKTVISILFAK